MVDRVQELKNLPAAEPCDRCNGVANWAGEGDQHWIQCTRCGNRGPAKSEPSHALRRWNVRAQAGGGRVAMAVATAAKGTITLEEVQDVLIRASLGEGEIEFGWQQTNAIITLGDWWVELFMDSGELDYVETVKHRDGRTRDFQSFYDEHGTCPASVLPDDRYDALEARIKQARR